MPRSRSRARCREYGDQQEVREVEALFCDMIASAERTIYIENQFLTCDRIAKALVKRLKEKPELEVLMIAPHTPDTWLESHTMRNGRIRFWRMLARGGRRRPRAPRLSGGARRRARHPHDGAFEGDDHRRPPAAHRLGQSQSPLDGHRQRMRSRDRGAQRRRARGDRPRARAAAGRSLRRFGGGGRAGSRIRLADPRGRHAERAAAIASCRSTTASPTTASWPNTSRASPIPSARSRAAR